MPVGKRRIAGDLRKGETDMTKRKKGRGRWEIVCKAGQRGYTVTIKRDRKSGILYGWAWSTADKAHRLESLRHRDVEKAKTWALEMAARLRNRKSDMLSGRVTVGRLLSLYLRHKTPQKRSEGTRAQDQRRAEMWVRVLGAETDATEIDLDWFEDFITRRSSGEIDSGGQYVGEGERKPVRARTVEADVLWLAWVYHWAGRHKVSKRDKQRLLAKGLVDVRELRESVSNWPDVSNVRRPVATIKRYLKVSEVVGQVKMGVGDTQVESYLPEVLNLVFHTGRRLSAILNLKHGDFNASAEDEQGRPLPHGTLMWRGEFDKQGKPWVAPLNLEAQQTLLRLRKVRPGVGEALMFPSPEDPTKPVARHRVDKWLRRAEKLADLEPQDGSLWHAYRRGWVTARSHHSAVVTAHAGGWRSTQTMERCYQISGLADQLDVITNPAQIQQETG